MAICYKTYKSQLDEDRVLDSRFYDPKKNLILKLLSRSAQIRIIDEYDEIIELSNSIDKISFPAILYDLPHSLGNVFDRGKTINSVDEIGSTKKIATGHDFAISRLRHYLKEFSVIHPKKEPQLLSTEYIILRSKGRLSTTLLIPYLLTEEIQYIFKCSQRGSNHPRLAHKDILRLSIPSSIVKLDSQISDILLSALSNFEKFQLSYSEAEQELLTRLKWRELDTEHIINYSITSKDFARNMRFDAEYYQPKFKNLLNHLKKIDSVRIKEFCQHPNRGIQPQYEETGDIIVINSKHLRLTQIDIESAERTSEAFYSEENTNKARLKQFDVLMYSTGAYIGRTNVYLEKCRGIASNHVTIIRPNNKICDPTYLALFLNSPVGLMQSDQKASGSAQREIYPHDIAGLYVFVPQNKSGKVDMEWQRKLAAKVIKVYHTRSKVGQKIQEAKRLVNKELEKLIE